MRRILMLLIMLILLLSINQNAGAIGVGGTTFIDDFVIEEGQWNYQEGVSPYLALNAKYSDNLFFSLSAMKSSHQPGDEYKIGDEKLAIKAGELDYLQLLLNGKYNFRANETLQPFVIAGAGAYKFDYSVEAKNDDSEAKIKSVKHQVEDDIGFGANLGLGIDLKLRENLLIGIDGRYNYTSSDYYEGGSLNLIFDISYGFR